MLELRECSASYPGRPALDRVSLAVRAGQTGCIVGPSGCGKTTLLMLAAGLKRPDAGAVLLEGTAVAAGDRRIGLILQEYGLFPWFTALENVALGLRIRGVKARPRRVEAAAALTRVGLSGKGGSFPRALSGGERQRVAIARGMVHSPRLLLMDEPFSALDALTRESSQELLLTTLRGSAIAVLLVTHSIEEAAILGRTIWLLSGAPGRVVERFENPGQGTSGYRADPAFFRLCGRIREAMRESRDAAHAS
jgi:ABC-type nitrate/sulfonate/bicarbonate transport system ATPase subunit